MPPRLLVVEDDDLQQSVLKSALERRGYEVKVASDGLSAVREIRAGGFDLALIDYHLPEIDGLASARLLRDLMNEDDRPKLIAVTAALDHLSHREMSETVFDAIVPKPLELPALLSVVDTHLRGTASGQAMRAAEATWREFGLRALPAAVTLPAPTPAQAQLLRCYFDLSGRRAPELVLLLGPEAAEEAVEARAMSPHFALPFVDLSGRCADADATFSAADRGTWRDVAAVVRQFADRCQILPRSILEATDLDTRLLAYLYLSGRQFQPVRDYLSRSCVRYPGCFPDGEVRSAAERLASRGLLERHFFDRFHACLSCNSFRLNVREECPACRSARLRDIQLVHHFRCAHQGPEADFQQGVRLVCPKCRQQLRHYGSDYSKPGTAFACDDCERICPEPAIGFACLDCGAHTDGAAAPKADVHGYSLTAQGLALLRRGTARLAAEAVPAGGALPEPIASALAGIGPDAALLELRYGARERIMARRGEKGFAAMRRLFLENLVNALEADCVHAAMPEADLLLIRGAATTVLAELNPALLGACQEVLTEGLEPELRRIDLPARAARQ